MHQFFHTILFKSLQTLGIVANKTTSQDKLSDFFNQINVYESNYPLIRIGGANDGGYLIPDNLDEIEACFSPGVSDIANFELELAENGIPSFLADYSVAKPPIEHELVNFEKKYLGTTNDEMCLTLEHWVNQKAPSMKNLMLQMDIEGSEYQVILDTPCQILKNFKVLVIEFHGLAMLGSAGGFLLIDSVFKKLLKNFDIVHIHPNNCTKTIKIRDFEIPPVMEFTFLQKKSKALKKNVTDFPHPLDQKNVPVNDDIKLPSNWY